MISDGNGGYTESSENYPSNEKYTLNPLKSGCIDINGNIIENTMNFNDNIVTYEMDYTSKCYLYFDYESITDCIGTLSECLIDNPTLGLNTNLEGGLYRYQGAAGNVNNFVCFGTTSREECLSDTDKYMYRIIGINENNQVKLIKKEALNTAYEWHSSNNTDTTWPDSDLYKGLNGSYYLETDYIPSDWSAKIANVDWKYGENKNRKMQANALFVIENNWNDITNTKIGLMYMHDYYYAYQSGGLNCSSDGDYELCKASWLYLWNNKNDSNVVKNYEWTMSYFGYYSSTGNYDVWMLNSTGFVGYFNLKTVLVVRPTFFLTPEISYISGTGTLENPIILQ